MYVDLSVAHFLLSEIYSTITEYILHFYILNELTHTVLDLPNNLYTLELHYSTENREQGRRGGGWLMR